MAIRRRPLGTQGQQPAAPAVSTLRTLAVLEARGLLRRFGRVTVLRGVDFAVRAGEVHALAGANGSGKSTLLRILSGALRPSAGTVLVEGSPVRLRSPVDGLRLGIATVPQELPLVPSLSVAENLFLGALPRRHGLVTWGALRQRAARALAPVDPEGRISPDRPVGELDLADRQLVAIARALAQGARVLLFDEPTSALPGPAAEQLLGLIGRLRAEGRAVVLVSQRLDDITAVADRVSVLRDGSVVAELPGSNVPATTLAELMAGHPVQPQRAAPRSRGAGELLEVQELRTGGRLAPISLSVRPGELLGVAGLPGSGVEELLPALAGRRKIAGGHVRAWGRQLGPLGVEARARLGIAYVSGDRRREGIVPGATVADNLTLAVTSRASLRPLRRAQLGERVRRVLQELDVRPNDPDALAGTLSGGNQQKLVVGRWLLAGARLWLLADPTRGVDVHARADIHRLLRAQLTAGAAAIMTSSELAELLEVCDRILVIHRGRVIAEVDPATTSEHDLLALVGGAAPTGERSQ